MTKAHSTKVTFLLVNLGLLLFKSRAQQINQHKIINGHQGINSYNQLAKDKQILNKPFVEPLDLSVPKVKEVVIKNFPSQHNGATKILAPKEEDFFLSQVKSVQTAEPKVLSNGLDPLINSPVMNLDSFGQNGQISSLLDLPPAQPLENTGPIEHSGINTQVHVPVISLDSISQDGYTPDALRPTPLVQSLDFPLGHSTDDLGFSRHNVSNNQGLDPLILSDHLVRDGYVPDSKMVPVVQSLDFPRGHPSEFLGSTEQNGINAKIHSPVIPLNLITKEGYVPENQMKPLVHSLDFPMGLTMDVQGPIGLNGPNPQIHSPVMSLDFIGQEGNVQNSQLTPFLQSLDNPQSHSPVSFEPTGHRANAQVHSPVVSLDFIGQDGHVSDNQMRQSFHSLDFQFGQSQNFEGQTGRNIANSQVQSPVVSLDFIGQNEHSPHPVQSLDFIGPNNQVNPASAENTPAWIDPFSSNTFSSAKTPFLNWDSLKTSSSVDQMMQDSNNHVGPTIIGSGIPVESVHAIQEVGQQPQEPVSNVEDLVHTMDNRMDNTQSVSSIQSGGPDTPNANVVSSSKLEDLNVNHGNSQHISNAKVGVVENTIPITVEAASLNPELLSPENPSHAEIIDFLINQDVASDTQRVTITSGKGPEVELQSRNTIKDNSGASKRVIITSGNEPNVEMQSSQIHIKSPDPKDILDSSMLLELKTKPSTAHVNDRKLQTEQRRQLKKQNKQQRKIIKQQKRFNAKAVQKQAKDQRQLIKQQKLAKKQQKLFEKQQKRLEGQQQEKILRDQKRIERLEQRKQAQQQRKAIRQAKKQKLFSEKLALRKQRQKERLQKKIEKHIRKVNEIDNMLANHKIISDNMKTTENILTTDFRGVKIIKAGNIRKKNQK